MTDRLAVSPTVDSQTEAAALAELVLCENLAQTSGWAARWSAKISGADGALLWVPHSVNPAFLCIAAWGAGTEENLRRSASREEGIVQQLMRDRAVAIFDRAQIRASSDPLLSGLPSYVQECIVIPLEIDRLIVGVMALLFRTKPKAQKDLGQIDSFIRHAAPALTRALRAERKTVGMLHAIERLTNLYDLSKAFTSTIDLRDLSETVVKKAVDFASAEVASLWMLDRDGGEVVLAATATNERFAPAQPPPAVGKSIAAEVLANRASILRNDLHLGDDGYAVHSLLALPLMEGETIVGALVMANKRGKRAEFTSADEELLTDLGHQAARALGVALERARATQVQLESERFEQSLRLANEIQMRMLPPGTVELPGDAPFALHAYIRPAKMVGGDLYDFFWSDNGLHFCIGDVSGKGIGAALVMAMTKTLYRAHASYENDPSKVMSAVNARLYEETDPSMFVTAFFGFLDLRTGRLHYANAGHEPPLIIADGQPVRRLERSSGLPLGVLGNFNYIVEQTTLEEGDAIFLYTDGVTEATSPSEKLFSLDRLRSVLDARSSELPSATIRAVVESVDRFAEESTQADDITMLCLQYRGARTESAARFRRDLGELENVFAFLEKLGVAANARREIDLAVEEIFTNFVTHNPTGRADIEIRARRDGDEVSVTLIDRDAQPFDMSREPDVHQPLDKRTPGGLGVFLARKMMDRVEYQYQDHVGTVTLYKRVG
jgi:serine phosphatase RsbU (regulator of sigma subunit)/anti-sigma regulatory factor (Ser/Thr protein kinase)